MFGRLADHGRMERIADLAASDWAIARAGARPPVHPQIQLGRVGRSDASRRDFLAQRRAWGSAVEAKAASSPIDLPAREPRNRLRLGFVSSDLRQTVLGIFAWPLFEHRDPDVDLYAYSAFAGPEDPIQRMFRHWSTGFRVLPNASARAMAQQIAADDLDGLIELGDPYSWEVAAYRPAPIQLSWMGFSGSSGIGAIDGVILDPFLAPEDRTLLLEPAILMPRSWLAMSPAYFEPEPAPSATTPEHRNGFVTFGTMNAPYKFSRDCLDAWAEVLARTPRSEFLLVRPEAAARHFRDNVAAAFALRGVSADRIRFESIRGAHLGFYNEIDIALDTFPVTGGTTTCETLWMGVPVVSLVGPSVAERLSFSLLSNAGLADLTASTREGFVSTATALAADSARRADLKHQLRDRIRQGPLGDDKGFAQAFYERLAAVIERGPAQAGA